MRFNLFDFFKNDDGNIAMMFAMLATPVLVLAGGGIDFSRAVQVRSQLQQAIDASVVASVGVEEAKRNQYATDIFTANMGNQLTGAGTTIGTPTFTSNADGTFSGTVSGTVPTTTLSLIQVEELSVSASASARPPAASSSAPCILLLDPSAQDAVKMISSSNVQAPECEIHVHSNHSSQAGKFSSLSSTTFKKICIKGGATGTASNLETGCTPAGNPYEGVLPSPPSASCSAGYNGATIKTENLTISDGTVFCGNTHLKEIKNLTFEAGGIFVIKNGQLKISAKNIDGNGVTFYFAQNNARLYIDSEDGGNLSAPTSGTYEGILMYMPDGLGNATTTIISTNFQNWTGIVYVPSWDIELISPSSWDWEVTLVANTLDTDSVSDWEIEPFDTSIAVTAGSSLGGVLTK